MKIMCTELRQIDKRCIHVGFFLFDIFFLRLVCFVLYLFVFDNRLISNFISVFFFCFKDITSEWPTNLYMLE